MSESAPARNEGMFEPGDAAVARPSVSVVVPCYNQSGFLDDALTSCREAYDGPLQVIIVDDGSTDPATDRHLRALADLRIDDLVVIRQKNGGLANARNVGLARATGEFVQLLDADDLLARGKIAHQLRQFAIAPSIDVSVTDYYVCDGTRSDFEAPPSSIAPYALDLEALLFRWERGLSIPIHSALFRRRVFDDGPAFLEGQRAKEDWIFWVGLALRGIRLAYLPLRLAIYRVHGSNMTRSWAAMGLEWLKAARYIEGRLAGRHPEFMGRCYAWYRDCYLARARADEASKTPPTSTVAVAPGSAPEPVGDARSYVLPRPASVRDGAGISVLIPVFNHARHLEACIRSAANQTHAAREIVCVDDASTEPEVAAILGRLEREIPTLQVHRFPQNRGIAAAQNHGLQATTGEFVAFLDCDDRLHPDALATVAAEISSHAGVDYLFTDRIDIDAAGRELRRVDYGGYPAYFEFDRRSHHDNLLYGMIASHLKVVRRSRMLSVGGFDASTSGVQDWDMAVRVATPGNLHYVPQALYYHRIHAESVTSSQRVRMFRLTNEVRRREQCRRANRNAAPGLDEPARRAVADLLQGNPSPGADVGVWRWNAPLDCWRHAEFAVQVCRSSRPFRLAHRLWLDARATVFALSSRAPATDLAFLREWNSLFDLVVCADEAQWATLHRYLFDARALRLLDELSPVVPAVAAT